ncbi:fasciclin domain-containing protein [uncultured Tateyamaria sp.]|uniref:fasciclin domain-containing protein n=1 Tax=uncultured Tateyamaria sp. TaxID=455651 RepID=UPI0026109B8E|nr:fasciclin domain-containing protein [uncultured Tateyamaria sp.]
MPTTTFNFTGFAESDLSQGNLGHGSVFMQPDVATLEFEVTDNDAALSGDIFDFSIDRHGQEASILSGGEDVGTGARVYAERAFHLTGSDGNEYVLIEIEQEHSHTDYFTYRGAVPPAGTELTVTGDADVFHVAYADLGAGDTTQNIVAIAAGSDDFNILVQALTAANLVGAVQNSNDITVFAPTDAAFTQLAVDLGFTGDTSDEDAVFGAIAAALTELAPDGDPIPLLTDILLYHVSPGARTADEIAAAGTIDTLLAGASIGADGTELIDAEPDIENPNIVVPDITATNGTIQAIDRVLLPLDIPGNTPEPPELPTLTGLVAASGGVFDTDGTDFDILLNAVQAAGLAGALDDPEADLTVFAPNDAAFVGLATALGFAGSDEGEAFAYIVDALSLLSAGGDPIALLTDILLYHVSPGSQDADAVLGSTTLDTLLGATIGVDGATLVDNDPDVPDPNLIATNLEASNGIAHVIDGVLLPVDVLQSNGPGRVDFVIDDDSGSVIRTGWNDDFASGKGGNDFIRLGSGNDVGLGGDGDDLILGGRGNDTMDGGNDDDRLFGGSSEDVLIGGDGNDTLGGGRDDDTLDGGNGNDRLIGSHGDDELTGGEGEDIFVFGRSGGDDLITDFTQGEDAIALRNYHGNGDLMDIVSDGEDGAVISYGRTTVTLDGIMADQVTVDDFLF